jgi:gluconolactonase
MNFKSFITFILIVSNTLVAYAQETTLYEPGRKPKLISRQFSFTEGPATDKRGNIFFTDQPNNRIWEYDINGRLSIFMEPSGRSNGMYFDKNGNLISCADEHNQLWSISRSKKVTILINDLNGKKLNGPNDVWIAPNGNMYITDPYYQRDYWKRTKPELQQQNVYLLKQGQKNLITVIDDLKQPNGIVGTPDGKYLFVADIQGNKTFRYSIEKDGSLKNKTLFAELGSDGMTLDNSGNLYLTGNGVTVFDSRGNKIAHIDIPEKWTANVAFGGKHKDQLFITSSEGVYLLKMRVHGVE